MAGAPLLQVLTRCFRRPRMLTANMRSVVALGAGVEQTLLIDTGLRGGAGRGVGASYEALAALPVRGQYIWILDDDDVCIFPDLLRELRKAAARRADVVVVRMDHGDGLGVLPDDAHWKTAPELGKIGCSACIVRREVWLEARSAFVPGSYTSDFEFARFLLDAKAQRRNEGQLQEKQGYLVEWLDEVASRVQRRSMGAAE